MIRYLNRKKVAERIGVTPGALSRYRLPEPDAWIGDVRGWLPATIDAWQATRPGSGARTDLQQPTLTNHKNHANVSADTSRRVSKPRRTWT